MKLILGTVAAVMLAGVMFAQPAEARCNWNGYGWHCWHHSYHHDWRNHRHTGGD